MAAELTVSDPSDGLRPEQLELLKGYRAKENSIAVLPERVEAKDGERRASFLEVTQALRAIANDHGVAVELMAPDGYRRGIYSEHDAGIVLPVILGVISNFIYDWICGVANEHSDQRMTYREIDGDGRLIEINGPAKEVVEAVRTRFGSDS